METVNMNNLGAFLLAGILAGGIMFLIALACSNEEVHNTYPKSHMLCLIKANEHTTIETECTVLGELK